jgi:hypothetical protein
MKSEELADALDRAGGNFPMFVNALDQVFDQKRAVLNAAIDTLDEECGELEPHVRDAVAKFIDTMWGVF